MLLNEVAKKTHLILLAEVVCFPLLTELFARLDELLIFELAIWTYTEKFLEKKSTTLPNPTCVETPSVQFTACHFRISRSDEREANRQNLVINYEKLFPTLLTVFGIFHQHGNF